MVSAGHGHAASRGRYSNLRGCRVGTGRAWHAAHLSPSSSVGGSGQKKQRAGLSRQGLVASRCQGLLPRAPQRLAPQEQALLACGASAACPALHLAQAPYELTTLFGCFYPPCPAQRRHHLQQHTTYGNPRSTPVGQTAKQAALDAGATWQQHRARNTAGVSFGRGRCAGRSVALVAWQRAG